MQQKCTEMYLLRLLKVRGFDGKKFKTSGNSSFHDDPVLRLTMIAGACGAE